MEVGQEKNVNTAPTKRGRPTLEPESRARVRHTRITLAKHPKRLTWLGILTLMQEYLGRGMTYYRFRAAADNGLFPTYENHLRLTNRGLPSSEWAWEDVQPWLDGHFRQKDMH